MHSCKLLVSKTVWYGQFVMQDELQELDHDQSAPLPTARSLEVFVHDGSMSWFLINRSVKSCKPDEPELIKHVQVSPTP